MLTSLRIQNFRSIRDATVKLGQVNLFIGPNNSGKSNFLKGVEWAANTIQSRENPSESEYDRVMTRGITTHTDLPVHIVLQKKFGVEFTAGFGYEYPDVTPQNTLYFGKGSGFHSEFSTVINEGSPVWTLITNIEKQELSVKNANRFQNLIQGIVIYRPDPNTFQGSAAISNELRVSAYASNLVPFLFNLSQNHKGKFRQLEIDLARTVGDLISLSTPADPYEVGKLRLKFFDHKDHSFWAEEVSEGVLYFLALLCIVHQPDPPKLLLLEEPEKGIHPRRIREVMDFIFELARLRDIQIILTSHSPYVVDYFADIPNCISVFDRDKESGETVIHNAGDIIKATNDKLKAAGEEEIHYSDALGEYWVSGFLGGVPEA